MLLMIMMVMMRRRRRIVMIPTDQPLVMLMSVMFIRPVVSLWLARNIFLMPLEYELLMDTGL